MGDICGDTTNERWIRDEVLDNRRRYVGECQQEEGCCIWRRRSRTAGTLQIMSLHLCRDNRECLICSDEAQVSSILSKKVSRATSKINDQ